MMRKGYIFVLLLVVVAGFYLYFSKPDQILSQKLELSLYGEKGLMYLDFVQDLPEPVTLKISQGNVILADEVSVPAKNNWRSGVPIRNVGGLNEGSEVEIDINGITYVRTINIVSRETDVLELSKVTNPEESMKGWTSYAYAHDEPIESAYRPGVPDIGQEIAECAPTSAANSLISLMEEHGVTVPEDKKLISDLKADMDWTPENGVLPPQFVEGKNKWAARNGLRIRTTLAGDQHGRGSLEKIMDEMAHGGAAELRIKFADAQGKATGGHMVTVVGVRTEGGQTFIDINDPRTPEGTDTYEVNGNVIEGYPYNGMALVSWGFVQTWEGDPTGVQLDPLSEEEIQGIQEFVGQKEKIRVIPYSGKKIPLSEVTVIKGDHCDDAQNQFPHYHASNGSSVTATDGTVITDHNACGFGKVKDTPVEEIEK
jgi:hypothetical protein